MGACTSKDHDDSADDAMLQDSIHIMKRQAMRKNQGKQSGSMYKPRQPHARMTQGSIKTDKCSDSD